MRQWWYEQQVADAPLMALLPGGIHSARGFDQVPDDKPFLVNRFSTSTPDLMDENKPIAGTQYVWVWAHDEPGSYLRIDDVLDRVKFVMSGRRGTPGSGIHVVRFVGSSDDLFDDQMGTVCRFDRYTIAHT